ncbi:MAG: PEGA domain-containing protein, partial [Methanomicrobiales archaeon]|nr:PEGA domain-containing protein [Methanomicrobiales archaeon]
DGVDPGLWDGNITEGCVASVLWDIFDSGFDNDDNIDNQFNKTWKIMTEYNPDDIDQFYSYWELEYGDGDIVDLSEIYCHYMIYKAGLIFIQSTPSSADIYLDGVYEGKTGIPIINIPAGYHLLEVKLDGYSTYSEIIDINTDDELDRTVSLLPLTGSVSITSNPTGASVSIDGVDRGVTPLTISGISEGTHSLSISKSGYEEHTEILTVVVGQTTEVNVSLTVVGVIPFPGTTSPPLDLDQDGLYEDVNGDGVFSFGDIRTFFENYDVWIPANEPVACFDFDHNSVIGFGDVRALFLEWGS